MSLPSHPLPDIEPRAVVEYEGLVLRLVLPAGEHVCIEAATLWTHCPSALRRRQRLDGRLPAAPHGVRIAKTMAIGRYALNIAFSDGHDRGVYPWPLLVSLAQKPTLSDFLIPSAEAGIALHAVN